MHINFEIFKLYFLLLLFQALLASDETTKCTNCYIIINKFVKQLNSSSPLDLDKNEASRSVKFNQLISNLKKELDNDRRNQLRRIEEKLKEWFLKEFKLIENVNLSLTGEKLCVPTFCCPKRKYGENCSDCDKCSPHGGYCDGSGTKTGTGKCLCNSGYEGIFCDQCDLKNYFKSSSSKDYPVCSACYQGCKSGCKGKTSKDCLDCDRGFEKIDQLNLKTYECKDIDECNLKGELCPGISSYCLNTLGSFQCKRCDLACYGCTKGGPSGCKSCAAGYEWVGDKCMDIDECHLDSMCIGNGEMCINKPGTYQCVCQSGYDRFEDKCVRRPPKAGQTHNRRKTKNKIIWTVPFFIEFCKMLGSLVALGIFSFAIKGRPVFVVFASSIVCYYIFHKSIRLDTLYNAQK